MVKSRRRAKTKGDLPGWVARELDAIPGWTWDPLSTRHRRKLRELRSYVKRHRRSPPHDELSHYASRCREAHKNRTLSPAVEAALDKIPGWTWDVHRARHEHNVKLLRDYATRHGWEDFSDRTVVRGVRLGLWARNRRRARVAGTIPRWLVLELNRIPGWTWKGASCR